MTNQESKARVSGGEEGRDERRARIARAALTATRERVSRMPDWYRLRYDLFARGAREPEFSTSVALLANGRAAVLLSRFDGPALQRLADPEGFDLNAANGFFANMAQGVVGMD